MLFVIKFFRDKYPHNLKNTHSLPIFWFDCLIKCKNKLQFSISGWSLNSLDIRAFNLIIYSCDGKIYLYHETYRGIEIFVNNHCLFLWLYYLVNAKQSSFSGVYSFSRL